ncbi:hypothetical protein [Micromonospora sp. DT233]|uniref:hypothetical protein n=1 Tax=Micromonospora sp. DT233 TaxID=3393432 RepID=UPI003CE91D46
MTTEDPRTPGADRQIRPGRRDFPDRHGGLAAVDFGTTNSTVTLYDPYRPPPQLPMPTDQRAALCRETVALLRAEPAGHDLAGPRAAQSRAEWLSLRDRIATTMAGVGARDLAEALEADEAAGGTLLYRVLLALDLAQPGGTAPFAAWLADRLHRCYDIAFDTPALEHHCLFPVRLDSAIEAEEVPSRLDVVAVDPRLRVRLGLPLGDGVPLASVRGLKHHLDEPDFRVGLRDDHRSVDLEALLGGALGFLLDCTDEFTRTHPDRLENGHVDQVVATYPTMAPPSARQRLARVLTEVLGVGEADLRYDEAISAALFFLMRDLGAHYAIGIEALRARFRPVPGRSRQWIENNLVIDIGGGTTDIALVTIDLRDETPELPGAGPGTTGRFYRLLPRLRGTSGRARRGGDFLTLQVFHLLKALIADHLLSTDYPDTGRLDDAETWREWQHAVTAQLDASCCGEEGRYVPGRLVRQALTALRRDTSVAQGAAGRRLRDNVERVVGTRTVGAAPGGLPDQRQRAFGDLWNLAERAKITIAPGRPFRLTADVVQDIVSFAGGVPAKLPPTVGSGPLELSYEDFAEVTEPMLVEVCRLAAGLARARLGPGERLDRVILTGKASQLALAAEVAARELAAGDRRGEPPVRVVVERTYAKNAASMGAAWAASLGSLGAPVADEELLRQGATEVAIEVENMLLELPCALSVQGRADQHRVLLPAGTPLREQADGRLRAFATIGPLGDRCIVRREVDGGQPVPWGVFRWSELDSRPAATQPARRLDRQVWPRRIRAGVEVDGGLNLDLLLWRGDRPYLRVDRAQPARRLPAELLGVGVGDVDGVGVGDVDGVGIDATVLADRLYVVGAATRRPQPALGAADGSAGPTRETFVDERGEPRAGVLGGAVLPPPDDAGQWSLLFRADDDRHHRIGTLSAVPGTRAPHVLSLDADGAVRVHAGDPPLWTAEDPVEIEQRPGLVFRVRLGVPRVDVDDHDDPFDGTH